jgi:hypothetical protein
VREGERGDGSNGMWVCGRVLVVMLLLLVLVMRVMV